MADSFSVEADLATSVTPMVELMIATPTDRNRVLACTFSKSLKIGGKKKCSFEQKSFICRFTEIAVNTYTNMRARMRMWINSQVHTTAMAVPVFLTVKMAACLSGWHTATYLSSDITASVRGEIDSKKTMSITGTPHAWYGIFNRKADSKKSRRLGTCCKMSAKIRLNSKICRDVSQNTCLLLRVNSKTQLM